MPISRIALQLALSATVGAGVAMAQGPRENDPGVLFSKAYSAYAAGKTGEALTGYRAAAELGHLAAAWKLARMYESGDGIERSDAQAFATYREIARRFGDIRPRDRDAVYVSSAFLRLAHYLREGVDSVTEPNESAARRAYFYAASYFGDADAQFELGRMMLAGEGGPRAARNALRWLNSAAQKGHVGATARLGAALYYGEGTEPRRIQGLAMLMRAAAEAREGERNWIEPLRDDALGASTRAIAAEAKSINAAEGS